MLYLCTTLANFPPASWFKHDPWKFFVLNQGNQEKIKLWDCIFEVASRVWFLAWPVKVSNFWSLCENWGFYPCMEEHHMPEVAGGAWFAPPTACIWNCNAFTKWTCLRKFNKIAQFLQVFLLFSRSRIILRHMANFMESSERKFQDPD